MTFRVPNMPELMWKGEVLAFTNLPEQFGEEVERLPVVLRLLLENVVRNTKGDEKTQAVSAIFDWLKTGSSESEIPYLPGRVLMHDTTSTPALVDIAAMRDALAEAGVDPSELNPTLPVDVSVDHSLAVESFGVADAVQKNMQHEMRRNAERYSFLRWASQALNGVKIHPPGTGIMHTINLEQLASVVKVVQDDGVVKAIPDMMLGTDSHTPMINGIGVLGWGVGGLEAQTVMFGMPTMLRVPDVIGVRLIGQLKDGIQSTDLALVVTSRLRELGVTGEFVEFFGEGVSTLSAGDRCVVANMAPEYGATTGFFPVDNNTLVYLKRIGRAQDHLQLIESYCKRNALWFDAKCEPTYTKVVEIDLDSIGLQVAGPKRPQDLREISQTRDVLEKLDFRPIAGGELPTFPVALAAITSCTNTSDPALLIAAALLARNARKRGLRVPSWVKTSMAPGSPASELYLSREGLLGELDSLGFGIVGYGCTTCIGNSGPLPTVVKNEQNAGHSKAVAILSGNRNFPGRVHPDIELSFIMSPMLVVAFALAGDASVDLQNQPLGRDKSGNDVWLCELLPSHEEIEQHVNQSLRSEDFSSAFSQASKNPMWLQLQAPVTPLYPWNANSTALRRPPFTSLKEGTQLGKFDAHPLLVLGDDVTTDHISPASAIPPNSLVADFLVSRGDDRDDLNVFASRRGNWEVMMRAAFHSRALVNHLALNIPLAHTLHAPSGDVMPIWDVADRYRSEGASVVIVAGERYGMGSSRDWAAKGQRLLGIRAVLAVSFERIHRSNLIGMGILPIKLLDQTPKTMDVQVGDVFEIDARPEQLRPRVLLDVHLIRAGGERLKLSAIAAIETQLEVQLLKSGGVIPSILKQTIQAQERCELITH